MNRAGERWASDQRIAAAWNRGDLDEHAKLRADDDTPPTLADGVDLVDLVGRPLLALVDGKWLRVQLVNVETEAESGRGLTRVSLALAVDGPAPC